MTTFDVVSLGMTGLLLVGVGIGGIVVIVRRLIISDPVQQSLAAKGMAADVGLEPASLETAELSGLVASGILEGEAPVSLAVRWRAPDATFTAFVAAHRRGREGFVIVTPHEATAARPRLADYARLARREAEPLPIPEALSVTNPGVTAHRLGDRLIFRKMGVEDGAALERLVMLACATLDAE